MLVRYVALLCLLAASVFAQNLFILSNLHKSENVTQHLTYFVDKKAELTLEDALLQEFKPLQRSNFGVSNSAIWTKVLLYNDTNKDEQILLVNQAAGIDFIDVWFIKETKVMTHIILGDKRDINLRPIKNRYSIAPIEIKAGEKIIFVARNANAHGATGVEWIAKTPWKFMESVQKDAVFWGTLIGAIFALIVYNLTLYVALREKFYIYYVLFAFSSLLYQLSVNGILYTFNIWLDMGFGSVYGFFSLIFIFLFGVSFFPIQKDFPLIFKMIHGFIFLHIGTIALLLFSIPSDIIATKITIYLALLSMAVAFSLSLLALYKKYKGSGFFFAGQIILISANLSVINVAGGFGDRNFFSTYSIAFATFVDLILLSIAIGYKIKQLDTQRKKSQILLTTQNRFSAMGKVVGNISHQWRQPISHLGTLVMVFDSIIRAGSDETAKKLMPLVPKLQDDVDFISKTMEEMNEFYKSDTRPSEFMVKQEIEHVLDLLSGKIKLMGVVALNDADDGLLLECFKCTFANAIMILIDNSIDMAKQNKTVAPLITINAKKKSKDIIITISDNLGGISQKPIESIFDPFVSSKDNSNGLGLPIAKMLVEQKLNGTITATNTKNGAKFIIALPIDSLTKTNS